MHSFSKKLLLGLMLTTAFTLFSCQTTTQTQKNNEAENTETVPPEEPDVSDTTNTSDVPDTSNTPESSDTLTAKEKIVLSRKIMDNGKLTATQLADYFLSQRADYDYIEIVHFAQLYVVEAAAEGINSDVAFAQMCLETGYLRFGGLVQPEFHNYCGLGAMDAENPGCIFETEQLGVRAHIQHLQAYATHEDQLLHNELIDPRYSWVHKTKYIETIEGLTGTWATDPNYAVKIEAILNRMEEMINQ